MIELRDLAEQTGVVLRLLGRGQGLVARAQPRRDGRDRGRASQPGAEFFAGVSERHASFFMTKAMVSPPAPQAPRQCQRFLPGVTMKLGRIVLVEGTAPGQVLALGFQLDPVVLAQLGQRDRLQTGLIRRQGCGAWLGSFPSCGASSLFFDFSA